MLFVSSQITAQNFENETTDLLCLSLQIKSKLAGEICKSFKKFKRVKSFYDYGKEAEVAIKNNKRPENIDVLIGNSTPNLKELVTSAILPEDFTFVTSKTFEDISFESYRGLTIEQKINYYRELVKVLDARKVHLNELTEASRALNEYKSIIQETITSSNELAKYLWEAYKITGGGLTEFSQVFGYNAIEIRLYVTRDMGKLKRRVNDEKKKIDEIKGKDSISTLNFKSNLSLILQNQDKKLNKDIDSLLNKQIELQDVVKYLNTKTNLILDAETFYKARVERNKLVYNELKDEKRDLSEILTKIEMLKSDLFISKKNLAALVYTGCSNNKTYRNCTGHPIAKAAFDKDKITLQKAVNEAEINLNTIKGENKLKLEKYTNKYRQFEGELYYLKVEQNNLEKRKDEINQKIEKWAEETISTNTKMEKLYQYLEINKGLIDSII